MPQQPAVVTAFVVDFEAALWSVLLPGSRTSEVRTTVRQFGTKCRWGDFVGLQRDSQYMVKWRLHRFIQYIYTQLISISELDLLDK